MKIEMLVNEQLQKLVDDLIKEKSTEIQKGKMVPVDFNVGAMSTYEEQTPNKLFTIRVR